MKKTFLAFLLGFQVLILTALISSVFALETIYPDWDYILTTGTYDPDIYHSSAELIVDHNGNGTFGDTGDLTFRFPPNSKSAWDLAVAADTYDFGLIIEYNVSLPGQTLVIYSIDIY